VNGGIEWIVNHHNNYVSVPLFEKCSGSVGDSWVWQSEL